MNTFKELIAHINEINAETKARGEVGMLTNDPHHWAGNGVYTVGQLQDYLERECERNLRSMEY